MKDKEGLNQFKLTGWALDISILSKQSIPHEERWIIHKYKEESIQEIVDSVMN